MQTLISRITAACLAVILISVAVTAATWAYDHVANASDSGCGD